MGDSAGAKRKLRGEDDWRTFRLQAPARPETPVVCTGEMPRQLIREVYAPLPMEAGKPKRHDYHYTSAMEWPTCRCSSSHWQDGER